MMSKALVGAIAWAREENHKVDYSNPRFRHWVYAVHDEGTTMMIRSAFIVPCPQDPRYIAIFAEHHDVMVYARDDFQGIWELQQVEEEQAR